MKETTILTAGVRGIKRMMRKSNGHWETESSLEDLDVNCMAGVPEKPEVLYAGTQGRGAFRSNDAGHSWAACSMEGQIIKSIAISPYDSNIIYAGTKPAYMYLSQDGGRSWQELIGFRHIPWRWWWFSPAERPFQAYVQDIAISPSDPNMILAGIEVGAVVRSLDGGTTWSGHLRGALRDCHALKFHISNGEWAYEAGGTGGGASYSRDGGKTWHKRKNGLAKNYGVACEADPIQPEVWYVSVAPNPSKAYGQNAEAYLYRSTADDSWHPIGWEAHPLKHMPIRLTTTANEPGHLYAGLTNGEIWFSMDYGDNWEKIPLNTGSTPRSLIVI
jgi:hypothetical protein